MSEDRLQYDCVMSFRKNHKESRGALFEVNNKTNKGAYRKGLGQVAGASDLMFITIDGKAVGLELKENGSRHGVEHLKRQLEWGELMVNRNAEYVFIFSLEHFEHIMNKVLFHGLNGIADDAAKTREYVKERINLVDGFYKTVKLLYDYEQFV